MRVELASSEALRTPRATHIGFNIRQLIDSIGFTFGAKEPHTTLGVLRGENLDGILEYLPGKKPCYDQAWESDPDPLLSEFQVRNFFQLKGSVLIRYLDFILKQFL
ncbi:MAG: hypothetical protein MHMPM18_004143 [Marteilia pararefringens]